MSKVALLMKILNDWTEGLDEESLRTENEASLSLEDFFLQPTDQVSLDRAFLQWAIEMKSGADTLRSGL